MEDDLDVWLVSWLVIGGRVVVGDVVGWLFG